VDQTPASPAAIRPALQRARGEGRIAVAAPSGETRLQRLYQDGCAKIRITRDAAARGLEAVLLNTSGGLTGGDRLAWRAEAGPGAHLTLTTAACEKIYRARDGEARTSVSLDVAKGGRLDWLPQDTILFDGAALDRRLDADLAADAVLLACEAVVLGRSAMGEEVRQGRLAEHWRVRREGRLVFADDLRFDGPIAELADQPPLLDAARAYAGLLLVAPDTEARLADVREAIGGAGGASAVDGRLFCRIAATDGLALRRALIPAIAALRGAPPPRIWRT
jgi:urease accessory protein